MTVDLIRPEPRKTVLATYIGGSICTSVLIAWIENLCKNTGLLGLQITGASTPPWQWESCSPISANFSKLDISLTWASHTYIESFSILQLRQAFCCEKVSSLVKRKTVAILHTVRSLSVMLSSMQRSESPACRALFSGRQQKIAVGIISGDYEIFGEQVPWRLLLPARRQIINMHWSKVTLLKTLHSQTASTIMPSWLATSFQQISLLCCIVSIKVTCSRATTKSNR